MIALPTIVPAGLLIAALGLATLLVAAAIRILLDGSRLRARARRAAAVTHLPWPAEPARSGSLERDTSQKASLPVRAGRHIGLLGPDQRAIPPARLAAFAALLMALSLLLLRAGMAPPAALPMAFILSAAGFRWQRRREATAVARAFEVQLPDAIGLMVRCVRAGVPVAEAVQEAGAEMAAPAGPLFAAADRHIRLGRQLEDALWDMARVVNVAEFNFLCVAVAVQRETGGNLAETLAGLEATVRKRLALRLKVRALTSEARASALIIGALPLLMAAGLALLAPDYLEPLFATGPGRLLLATAIGSLLIGGGIMSHLVRRETGAA